MTDFVERIDSITTEFLDEYYPAVLTSERKLFGFTELITKNGQPMPVIINGTADRGTVQVSLDDKYKFMSWVRLPGTISQSASEEDNWGLREGRRLNAGLRWIVAHRVELGEVLITELLQYIPTLFVGMPTYEYVFVDDNISVNADHEGVYLTELGNTVYEKHRLTWNVYAIELNLEFLICQSNFRILEDGTFRILE